MGCEWTDFNSAPEDDPHLPLRLVLQAAGVRTKVGTWALSEAEASMIELSADRDEKWEASLVGKEQWLHKPLQPPGLLRSGALPWAALLWLGWVTPGP